MISLDFELHWGVRDRKPASGSYRQNLLGVWEAVPRMLSLFQEFQVAATWATVGFLFARSRAELEELSPAVRPAYRNPLLSPYDEVVGEGEDDDPLHYAPSLVRHIRETPGQEIGTHTFSHYYCLEPGQTREAFAADLASAVAAAARHGVRLRSIVFPRNQHNPAYDEAVVRAGIVCYRGNPRGWMYRPTHREEETALMRAARLLDAHAPLSGSHTIPWARIAPSGGLCNVPASFFLRPSGPAGSWSESLHLRRLTRALRRAAARGEIFHLWWHPHNFGVNLEQNLLMLHAILDCFAACRTEFKMESLTMDQVADRAMAVLP